MTRAMRFWGITGTNGKTTCTWIAAEMMRRASYITTVEVWTGRRRFYSGYTTPPLAQLKEIYSEMVSSGMSDCVMEVSSHAIHQNRVDFCDTTLFSGGAFTNLSEDHLDYHKSMDEYFRVKLSFAERIAEGAEKLGTVPKYIVCLDGENGERMFEASSKLPNLEVIPVSIKSPGYDLSQLKLVGDYNRSNALVAAALAEASGVPKPDIQRVIPTLSPRWGRLELVQCASKADVYVDFAHTPDGLEKVLTAARGFTKGCLWVVFGAGGDRDTRKRPLMGEVCANLADHTVITSDNPRSEEPEEIITDIIAGIPASARKRCHIEIERKSAIYYALKNADSGDTVLICGKGHETTQEIMGVKYPFDDREIARTYPGGNAE